MDRNSSQDPIRPISVSLRQSLLDRLDAQAQLEGRPRSNLVARLLEQALATPGPAVLPSGQPMSPRVEKILRRAKEEAEVSTGISTGCDHDYRVRPTTSFPRRQVCERCGEVKA